MKVFLFLRKQHVLFSQVLLFGLFLALKKKKAKDAGGWHSWFPGRGSNPCGIFALTTNLSSGLHISPFLCRC